MEPKRQNIYLWLKQKGEGYDYTIGCGNRLIQLKNVSGPLMKDEIDQILESYAMSGPEIELSDIKLLIEDDPSLSPLYLMYKTFQLTGARSEKLTKLREEASSIQKRLSEIEKEIQEMKA